MKKLVKVVKRNNAERFEKELQEVIDAAPIECDLEDIKFSTHFDTVFADDAFSAILIFTYAADDVGKVKNFKMK